MRSRKQLTKRLDTRLASHAVAAAAIGTVTPSAGAQIVYTQANSILTQGALSIDLNNDGTTDFYLKDSRSSTGYGRFAYLAAGGNSAESPAVIGLLRAEQSFHINQAFAVPKGVSIGSHSPGAFIGVSAPSLASLAFARATYFGSRYGGHWANVDDKYLGLRFTLADGIHYGWARLSVIARTHVVPNTIAKLTGYAYETTPNKSIVAGDRGFAASAGNAKSLGALALGAAGLRASR